MPKKQTSYIRYSYFPKHTKILEVYKLRNKADNDDKI